MSDLTQAALISGGIFVAVMLRGYGRRALTARSVIIPLAVIAVVGRSYLHSMPVSSLGDWTAYAVAVLLGLLFGAAASAVTRVVRRDGRLFTVTGPAFALIWAAAMVMRLVFIWAVEDNPWAREHFGRFMITHHISFDVIAPFFLLWAFVMLVVRLAAIGIRASRATSEPVDATAVPTLTA